MATEDGPELVPPAEEVQPGPSQNRNTSFHSAEFVDKGEQEKAGEVSYADLIKSAIEETNQLKWLQGENTDEIDVETLLETLPNDCTYKITSLQGTCSKFDAIVLTPDINIDNHKDWLRDYEEENNTCLRKRTVKGETTGYLMQTYYRCQHNTRIGSPSKDPQNRLSSNPTARVKNTNCPFQLVLKISRDNVTTITIHCDHNHSIGSLEASNFKDLSKETVEKVFKLFESGLTASTARQQFLKDLRDDCEDDLTFHQRKADRSIMPRKRDFSHLYEQFGKENYGGKDSQMFNKLVERLESYKDQNPEATTEYQMYEGESKPLIVALVTPLMKRVHKEVPQSGELVFIDATSNTEEHNLKVFMMCTHHVAGALPLGILITSDEKESTLCQGFQTLKSCLPTDAFYGNGPEAGPSVILTDNCSEERNALSQQWPRATLLLCTFHILQQVWRWLHDKRNKIQENDRPHLLSLFKKCLYSENEETFQTCCKGLFEDNVCKKYTTYTTYVSNMLDKKEAFALCFRSHLRVRGNHTNNFVEAQFLVLKDTILRRVKEYNVVGLIERITSDLENHYKTKLLSLADGSFDGTYRRRFMGTGKDGATGFRVPTEEEQTTYLSSVEQFENQVFRISSGSRPGQSHTVDMTVGVCSCAVGQDGSPCRHQYVLWAAGKAHCVNFVSVTNSEERQKLARVAIGEALPLHFYNSLRTVNQLQSIPSTSGIVNDNEFPTVMVETQVETQVETHVCEEQELADDSCIDRAASLLNESCVRLGDKLKSTNDRNLAAAIIKFSKRMANLTGPSTMHANLISALHDFGTNELKKTGIGKKLGSSRIERESLAMAAARLYQREGRQSYRQPKQAWKYL
ncbi:uncharacterized protein LOC144928219 [Branchiostoma floridae x Branchiostoma belcheri]